MQLQNCAIRSMVSHEMILLTCKKLHYIGRKRKYGTEKGVKLGEV